MLLIPKKTRPPKDPHAEKLYPETDTLKLPPAAEAIRPKEQKEITFALTRAHRKTGYPRLYGPVGVKQVAPYFIDRAKDIALQLKNYQNRHEKTKHYYDSCAHYDPNDPDLLYHQGVYYGQFNQYTKTLEKMEQCLQINPRDHRALLLKADTYFRMCDFETALLCYSQGITLRYPYRNWFLDGYYRTTALLYDLTRGDIPLFYGGNMSIFYRLVQGQERSQRIFNDTYKHYDELFPLEPNMHGVQSEINMFDVSKPEPPSHVQRRIRKAAMQQLKGARKVLGAFWNSKVEIEQRLIKREHFLPRFGRANQTEKIERAMQYLRGRIEKFEVICALIKSRQLREHYDKPIDWLLLYGRWMAEKEVKSSVPPASTGGVQSSRYKWALSQTLFDIREKPLDICWIRKHGRRTRSNHLLAQRRSWKNITGYKSAQKGALAALRSGAEDWPFMQKLKRTVWNELEQHAPPPDTLPLPKHIQDISRQIKEYERTKEALEKASKLVMPITSNEEKGKIYYDPESHEQQWDENRELVKTAQLKRAKVPVLIPYSTAKRPIPENLLEVFETKVHEAPGAWDQRRKMSMELRENLAKAEAVKAAHVVQEKRGLFGTARHSNKETSKVKVKKDSDLEPTESEERPSVVEEGAAGVAPGGETAAPDQADRAKSVPGERNISKSEKPALTPIKQPRKARRPGERQRYDILNKKSDSEYQDKPRIKRRIPLKSDDDGQKGPVEVTERVKTPEELEAERLLAARAEDPVEIARRIFDNQKAALLEKSYAMLMTCTKVSEFLEIELEIGDLINLEFPPATMRFPNGEPIILEGYPDPASVFTRMVPSEMFASRKKRKKKFGGSEGGRAVTAAEAAREADEVQRLMAEKGRRQSVLAAAGPPLVFKPPPPKLKPKPPPVVKEVPKPPEAPTEKLPVEKIDQKPAEILEQAVPVELPTDKPTTEPAIENSATEKPPAGEPADTTKMPEQTAPIEKAAGEQTTENAAVNSIPAEVMEVGTSKIEDNSESAVRRRPTEPPATTAQAEQGTASTEKKSLTAGQASSETPSVSPAQPADPVVPENLHQQSPNESVVEPSPTPVETPRQEPTSPEVLPDGEPAKLPDGET